MAKREPKPKFWDRGNPSPLYDIEVLRPASLPKGKRFETVTDSDQESIRSENLLSSTKGGKSVLREYLQECRDGHYHCYQTFCPRCARTFRRWFIGELLRTTEKRNPVHMLTVLLEAAPSNKIDTLYSNRHRAHLRKRLQDAGLGDIPVIGGFEMIYRAHEKQWILHINLVIVGATGQALAKFQRSFAESTIERPVVKVPVKDRPEQLSYVLKFTTYHRPYKQSGSRKSQAMPLNAPEHYALVKWMSQFEFNDLMFLFNARRLGPAIELHGRNAQA